MIASIANQFRRIYADNGMNDKDFTDREARLREAQKQLTDATEKLQRAAELLRDLLLARQLPDQHH